MKYQRRASRRAVVERWLRLYHRRKARAKRPQMVPPLLSIPVTWRWSQ